MKLNSLVLIAAAAVLTGCQTSSQVSSAAMDGDGITCSEIYQAFSAYDRDRQSAAAWAQLGEMISPSAGSYADMGVKTAAKYYDQVKAATNISLAVRGCQPVQ